MRSTTSPPCISSPIGLLSSLLENSPKSTPAIELPIPAGEVHLDLLGAAESMSYPSEAPPPQLPQPSSLPPPRDKMPRVLESPQPPPLMMMMSPLFPLYKRRSWSPDVFRDQAWLRRKGNSKNRRSKSVTEEDLDELKACIELGFGFDSLEVDQRLSDTLPALGLYHAVNKNYNDAISKYASSSPSAASDSDSIPSPIGSPKAIFVPGDNPQTVKTRLRQWAQLVACSVRQCS